MDKDDVVSISRQIETFDISVLPYDDCCTVFTPKHPRIKPKLESVIRAESGLETDALLEEAVKGVKVDIIK
jgi:thiamine biosynthesis protein ThiI